MRRTRLDLSVVCTILAMTTLPSPAVAEASEPRLPNRAAAKLDGAQSGNASFYAHRFAGRKTASGERYDPQGMTAAHRTLPMGTKLLVTNPKNDRSVIVTINDRGRLPKGRVVDVSSAAADVLDMKQSGVTRVHTQVVGKTGTPKTEPAASAVAPEVASDLPSDAER